MWCRISGCVLINPGNQRECGSDADLDSINSDIADDVFADACQMVMESVATCGDI